MNKIIKPNLLLRKRVADLEGALANLALDNHILKSPKISARLEAKEKLSGSISHQNLEL
ncbi:MAG: hypothetical protein HS129_00775 [Leptospiraceae bacterium]|nr:hypothetical protein [Leptospiraceae bacterium]